MKFYTFSFCLLLGLITTSLSAQVYVNGAATGNNDGTSWANAFTDLDAALQATPVDGEVWVAAGIYFPGGDTPSRESFYTFPHDMKLYGGFDGTESALSERNAAQNITQLSGDHNGDDINDNFTTNRTDNSRHVFFLTDTITSESVIDGFLITNGSTDDETSADDLRRGGGILTYGTPLVSNCTFSQNFGWFGGGIYPRFNDAGVSIVIQDCTFNNNRAGFGGGVYVNQRAPEIRNCVFTENSVANNGGGLFNSTRDGSIIDGCMFELNIAETDIWAGGGAGAFLTESPSTVTNSTFLRNTTTMRRGAGIFVRESSVTINGCLFDRNASGASTGAGVQVFSDSTDVVVTISDSEFTNGSSNWGAAVTSYGDVVTTNIVNCEMSNNLAITNGGAVYVGFGSTVNISDSELTTNEAGAGGALATQNDSCLVRLIDSDFSFNLATSNGGVANMFTIDSPFVANPKLEIVRSSFNFNDCMSQGGVLNLSDSDLTIESSVFTNNVNASDTGAGGVMSLNTSGPKVSEYLLVNNTFFANSGAVGSVIGNWTDDTGISTLTIQNNIFATALTDSYAIEAGTPLMLSNGGNMSEDASFMPYANELNDTHLENPLFTAPGFGEFFLMEGSPAIDSGIDDGAPEFDNAGSPRVGIVDKGAFEFDGTSAVEDLETSLEQLDVFPNPTTESIQYNLDNDWNGSVLLTVRNILGQVIHQESIQKSDTELRGTLQVSSFQTGSFLLNLRNETHSVTRTFVKK